MLFTRWIMLNIAFISINGQSEYYVNVYKIFHKQVRKYMEIQPQLNDSCLVMQHPSPPLYLTCPTEVNCYLKTYLKIKSNVSVCNFNENIENENITNISQVGPNIKQLSAVQEILRLTNETVCDFSPIETLDSRYSGMNNMGQVGRANCAVDNLEVSQCPYKLKYLYFGNVKIENLLNSSFCQFPSLEFLGLVGCGLTSIEADAFVHLIHLKEMTLQRNSLTDLPANLFANNIHLQTVDLDENNLQIYSINLILPFNSLRYLYLDYNNITTVEDKLLNFPINLEQIFVENNNLKSLTFEFQNLTNLTYLQLFVNNISEIDENAFLNLHKVRIIKLNNNKLENLLPNTFKDTLSLEYLSLSHNKLVTFPPIGHLNKLIVIYFAWNKISRINNSHLINCTQLSLIDLSNNELSFIEEGSFDNLKRLEKLFLSRNRLTQLSVNMQHTSISEIYLAYNNFTSFSYDKFSRSLIKLFLQANQIDSIELFHFPEENEWVLTHLNMSDNKIESIENLRLPNSIQEIDLSGNRISDIFVPIIVLSKRLEKMQSINLRRNNISILCNSAFYNVKFTYLIAENPLKCACENMWLKHRKRTDTFIIGDLDKVTCIPTRPHNNHVAAKKLYQLNNENFLCQSDDVNSNRCECPFVDNNICELPCPPNCTCLSDLPKSIIYFTCKSQNFENFTMFLTNNVNYINARKGVLDFSDNTISEVNIIDFGNLTTIFIQLNLSNSNITSIQQNAFDKLINLQILDLCYNQLQALPDQIFLKLVNLTHLDLSYNRLKNIDDYTFISQMHIKILYLHNNHLNRINLNQITQLKNLTNITLDDNNWSCECKFIESFRTFLVDSITPVNNKLQLNCTENGEEFNIPNFKMEKCLTQPNLTVLIVSLTFGTLLAITMGLVFKWRYELQVLVYARYGFRFIHRKQTEEEVESKQYDAFIAYNSADTDFLINELMPGLEEIDNPYRLCIHERDFPAGSYIQDSILDAISTSSRTIVLLSENFVSSGWCRYEFKSAHMQMLQDRCPRVLVILVGEVPGTLDPEMKLYLETNTYLKWGEKLFWQKLYYAMPDKKVTTPATDIMPMREL